MQEKKSRKPQLTRAMSIASVVMILSGGALGASRTPWWTVLLVIVLILGVFGRLALTAKC